ncbi:MAG: TRAP transporter permease [Desulfobacterales bacterium]|nr:TRAP transporter permease [Desulfobacterales bacterium]
MQPRKLFFFIRQEHITYYLRVIALITAIFHLYTAATLPFDVFVQRGVHLSFVLAMVFFLKPLNKNHPSEIDFFIVLLAWLCCGYFILNWEAIREQSGIPLGIQSLIGLVTVVLILEATRRSTGWALPILVFCFLFYAKFGNIFPRSWGFPGLSFDRIFGYLYLTSDGIWSLPLGVSSTVLVLFMIFGSILNSAGVGNFFTDFSFALAGRLAGGPAQVAVISSALLGTVTGSSTANVATTGSFTIPLMKSKGYQPHFAAGVEAVASTGAQIMPPIMGAGAFIMADMLNIPYSNIIKAAALPAVLYFLGVLLAVRFEAYRTNLVSDHESEKMTKIIFQQGYLFIPVIVIIYFIIEGHSPMKACWYGIITTLLVSSFKKKTRLNYKKILKALEEGAKNVVGIASACACAGIVLGVMNMTGLGIKVTTLIVELSGGYLPYALLLSMLSSLILGLELPTAVAYVIAAAAAAPALIALGVPPLVAHMFIFYFSILGTITPPVCLSVYVAAGIAEAHWLKTAGVAIKLALPAWILPYMFVYNNALLGMATPLKVVYSFVTGLIGMFFLAAGVIGYFFKACGFVERLLLALAGLVLIIPEVYTDIIGFALGIALILYQKYWDRIKNYNKNSSQSKEVRR